MAGSKELTTVLITGATGGIGRALAHAYARKGRRLILHGRDDTKLQELAAECTAQGASSRRCNELLVGVGCLAMTIDS